MDLGIDGNVAILTASSSGLGKASAKALAREGVNVVINGRDEDRLAEAVSEIEDVAVGHVVGQQGDLTQKDDIETLVERTISEFGHLDHLVTSAGGPSRFRPLEATDDDWYDAFDLLVMSVVRLVREVEPYLRASDEGTVVTITSRAVKQSSPKNILSGSVRMAVIGFEKALSTELAPEIRANAVLPGSHETPRVLDALERSVKDGTYDTVADARDGRTETIPVDRLGDPMETGNLVAYLSSPQSGYVNGQAIVIDGGATESTF